jgi:hypothetical protein
MGKHDPTRDGQVHKDTPIDLEDFKPPKYDPKKDKSGKYSKPEDDENRSN